MRPSPLTLKEYFTSDLHFSAQPQFNSDDASIVGSIHPDDLKVEITEKAHEENPLLRNCQISIELDDPTGNRFTYIFRITLVGFIEVIEEWPSDQVDKLVNANAPALLYSAARESLAMLTGRGPYPRILLPSVTFVKVIPQLSSEEALPSKKRAGRSRKRAVQKTVE
jgi:preprotein translocase subunit SecB